MTAEDIAEIYPGSGNVFADLGLPDAEERLAKAELARQLAVAIRERGESQKEVAKTLGVDQPKVSALLSGRLAGFSLERLATFLTILGKDVEIVISDKPGTTGTGRLTVKKTQTPASELEVARGRMRDYVERGIGSP